MKMENASENPTLRARKDAQIFFCWFVEDNGAGHSGYVCFGASWGRPLVREERLFSTVEELREALTNQENVTPKVVNLYPDWVPDGWKVRSLTTNEVRQLGLPIYGQ
jgi:hypothetical protein